MVHFKITSGAVGGDAAGESNTARSGGGVYLAGGNVNMSGGGIIGNNVLGNLASDGGGGVYVQPGATFTMSGGEITRNEAKGSTANGGGAYVAANGNFKVTGAASVTENKAINGDGGGIYTPQTVDYSNVTTLATTVFKGNVAKAAYVPANTYPTIASAKDVSLVFPREPDALKKYPLNNYDINYSSSKTPTYLVIYEPNYAPLELDVNSYIDDNDSDYNNANGPGYAYSVSNYKVKGNKDTPINIIHSAYTFVSWNTMPLGGGNNYMPNDILPPFTDDVTLYAKWRKTAPDTIHVIEYFITENGKALLPRKESFYKENENYTGDSPNIANYDYIGYRIGDGAVVPAPYEPSITFGQEHGDKIITYIYKIKTDNGGGNDSGGNNGGGNGSRGGSKVNTSWDSSDLETVVQVSEAGSDGEKDAPASPSHSPSTGDTGIAIQLVLMVSSLCGMAYLCVLGSKHGRKMSKK